MAEGQNHGDQVQEGRHYYDVEHIRVFQCNRPQDDHGESNFKGLFLFNVQNEIHKGEPRTLHELHEGVPFPLEALYVLGDHVSSWVAFAEFIVTASNLFQCSGPLAWHISAYLRSFFRFHSGGIDSIVIVVDVSRVQFTPEYSQWRVNQYFDLDDHDHDVMIVDADEGMEYDMEKIVRKIRTYWREGRDMELVELKPRMTVKKMVAMAAGVGKRGEEEEEVCSICLDSFTRKVSKITRMRWLFDSRMSEIVRLSCGHAFHHRCIFNWLPKQQSCPYCRSSCLTVF